MNECTRSPEAEAPSADGDNDDDGAANANSSPASASRMKEPSGVTTKSSAQERHDNGVESPDDRLARKMANEISSSQFVRNPRVLKTREKVERNNNFANPSQTNEGPISCQKQTRPPKEPFEQNRENTGDEDTEAPMTATIVPGAEHVCSSPEDTDVASEYNLPGVSTNTPLVKAELVEERGEEIDQPIVVAAIATERKDFFIDWRSPRVRCLALLCGLLLVGAIVGGVYAGTRPGSKKEPSLKQTQLPTSKPTSSPFDLIPFSTVKPDPSRSSTNLTVFCKYLSLDSTAGILAVSAPGKESEDAALHEGLVYVYNVSSPKPKMIGNAINGSIGFADIRARISPGGSRVVVGAKMHGSHNKSADDYQIGRIEVYEFSVSQDEWIRLGQPLFGLGRQARAGHDIAMSSDGDIIAVGMPLHSPCNSTLSGCIKKAGAMQAYTLKDGKWKTLGQLIEGTSKDQRRGWSVSLSDSGRRLIVGSREHKKNEYEDEAGSFAVFEYNREMDRWDQLGDDEYGMFKDYLFGARVGMSADGAVVAAGAHRFTRTEKNEGHVKVHQWDNNERRWAPKGEPIEGKVRELGLAPLALSANGNQIAVSGSGGLKEEGFVRVFTYQNGKWVGSQIRNGAEGSNFGFDVAMNRALSPSKTKIAVSNHGGNSCQVFEVEH